MTTSTISNLSGENPVRPTNADTEAPFSSDTVLEAHNVRISFFPSRRKKTKKINLLIEGDFTIYSVQFVKDNCLKLVQYYDMVNIALKNIHAIDLAAVQLLQALSTTLTAMQKTIHIESELSKEDKALITGAGLMDIISSPRHS